MQQRLLTILIAVPIALVIVIWPGGVPAVIAGAVILTLAFSEYALMCNAAGIPCRLWWGAAGVLLFVIHAQQHIPDPEYLMEAAILLGWAFLIIETGRPGRKPVAAIGSTLLGVLWIGGLGSLLIQLRFWPPVHQQVTGGPSNADIIIGLLIIVWSLDIFAYLVGRVFGRVPLAPAISPKKTMEGALGGFFAASIAGLLCAPLMGESLRDGFILGAAIGIAGQVGDLFESAVKRELGHKDSGGALPGHGGWLDRIDSLLFATGVAAWWLMR